MTKDGTSTGKRIMNDGDGVCVCLACNFWGMVCGWVCRSLYASKRFAYVNACRCVCQNICIHACVGRQCQQSLWYTVIFYSFSRNQSLSPPLSVSLSFSISLSLSLSLCLSLSLFLSHPPRPPSSPFLAFFSLSFYSPFLSSSHVLSLSRSLTRALSLP